MRYIVDFQNDVTQEQIDEYVRQNNGTIVKTWDYFRKVFAIDAPEKPAKSDIVEDIISDDMPVVKPLACKIEFNPDFMREDIDSPNTVTFSTSDEKDWWKNYVLKDPEFIEDTKTIPRKGENTTVYIMDSGIDKDHPEFSDTQIDDVYTITDGDFSDKNGHGTAIASVISGKTCGISSAKLKNVKIFQKGLGTYISDLLSAFDAIVKDHDPNKWNIVNCSWIIDYNEYVERKIQAMIDIGIIVVASSGNNNSVIKDVTPASLEDVFVVGSYGPDLVPSDFSNYTTPSEITYTDGETNYGALDVWAPGEMIWAACKNNGYGYTAGTSMSAAVASAVLAYTFSDFVNRGGYKSAGYRDISTPRHPMVMSVKQGNSDLIDFDDEKYANSTTQIITIVNRTSADVSQFSSATDDIGWTILLEKGRKSYHGVRTVNPYLTSTIEEIEALPDSFTITTCGSLTWDYCESLEPEAGETLRHITGKIKVTETDGYEEVRNINIYIMKYDYSQEDLPEDHDANLRLQFMCTAPVFTCQRRIDMCEQDGCGGLSCCAFMSKDSECSCQN